MQDDDPPYEVALEGGTQAHTHPWRLLGSHDIDGRLEAIGFAEESDLLLVLSNVGRLVFNAATGVRVALDYQSPAPGWAEKVRLRIPGIGPLADQEIRIAGTYGGGLPVYTHDRWHLQLLWQDWDQNQLYLEPPGISIFHDDIEDAENAELLWCLLDTEHLITTYGFSWTGNCLAIAEGNDRLHLYTRLHL